MLRLWLVVASCYFYAYWNVSFLPALIVSIGFNYLAGLLIKKSKSLKPELCTSIFIAAVVINLGFLGYFKYFGFLSSILAQLAGWEVKEQPAFIPLGISFFTFTQIAYLADVTYGENAEPDPVRYALFVSFFPHLIAGPILHHRETIPQFAFKSIWDGVSQNIAIGSAIFSFGLFKKVVLADGVQPFVGIAFTAQQDVHLVEAWTGVLAYTMQIYFDFSGYSDMAIGLARMFGVIFPLNFDSPYQATSIIDFWSRWHITLSRFLRDYLYIPLGGNRSGLGQFPNILITMFLGGLWHGAAWTFIIWGMLHGLYLIVNHAWRRWWAVKKHHTSFKRRIVSRCVTFLAVVVAWVFFRADGVDEAVRILSAMFGLNGWGSLCNPASAGTCTFGIPTAWYWIGLLSWVAFCAPNTQQIMAQWRPGLGDVRERTGTKIRFKPNFQWAFAMGVLFAMAVARLNERSQFLYYQF